MILEKKMSIKDIFIELNTIKVRLIKLAEKYNKSIMTITAVNWKDIVTSGSKKGDVMLNKVIKKEELLNEFDIVKQSYNDYKELAIEKIKEMISKESVGYCVVYFRDELKWKWEEIAKVFNYSSRQCRRLYNLEKNK